MQDHEASQPGRIQKVCAKCGSVSPEVDGEFALIREGWRLTLGADPAGRKTTDWWCPTCFAKNRPTTSRR